MTYLPRLRELEERLLAERGKPRRPIIALGGLAGTGKDTAAYGLQKLLAKDGIHLEVHIAGEVFRAAARGAGYSERELEKFNVALTARGSEELDLKIDSGLLEVALTKGGILVGRLAPAIVGEWGVKIWLETDPRIIAERISADPARKEYGMGVTELARRIVERNRVDAARYKSIYGIDPDQLKARYDLVLDNSNLTKEQTARRLHEFVRSRLPPQ